MPKTEIDLPEDEMRAILVDLARNSQSATARIQAIKTLRDMNAGKQVAPAAFESLYAVKDGKAA